MPNVLIGDNWSKSQLSFKDKCLLMTNIQEIAGPICPIRCQEFFCFEKKVYLQI